MQTIFRKTELRDIPSVVSMYVGAAQQMKADGIDQWQDGYPNEVSLREDINNGVSFVLCEGDSVIASAMVLVGHESTYDTIDGMWGNNHPYAVVHRYVVDTSVVGKGVAHAMQVAIEASLSVDTIRIDTHEANIRMQRFLEKEGFMKRGIIKLNDGKPRVAFDKILRNGESHSEIV